MSLPILQNKEQQSALSQGTPATGVESSDLGTSSAPGAWPSEAETPRATPSQSQLESDYSRDTNQSAIGSSTGGNYNQSAIGHSADRTTNQSTIGSSADRNYNQSAIGSSSDRDFNQSAIGSSTDRDFNQSAIGSSAGGNYNQSAIGHSADRTTNQSAIGSSADGNYNQSTIGHSADRTTDHSAIGSSADNSHRHHDTREKDHLIGQTTTGEPHREHGHGNNKDDPANAEPTPYWGDLPQGQGVYNTVTGHGSNRDESSLHHPIAHHNRDANSNQDTHNSTLGREHGTFPHQSGTYNSVIGHGSREENDRHQPTHRDELQSRHTHDTSGVTGTVTGTHHRDSPLSPSESRGTNQDSTSKSGLATVAGVGAGAGLAASELDGKDRNVLHKKDDPRRIKHSNDDNEATLLASQHQNQNYQPRHADETRHQPELEEQHKEKKILGIFPRSHKDEDHKQPAVQDEKHGGLFHKDEHKKDVKEAEKEKHAGLLHHDAKDKTHHETTTRSTANTTNDYNDYNNSYPAGAAAAQNQPGEADRHQYGSAFAAAGVGAGAATAAHHYSSRDEGQREPAGARDVTDSRTVHPIGASTTSHTSHTGPSTTTDAGYTDPYTTHAGHTGPSTTTDTGYTEPYTTHAGYTGPSSATTTGYTEPSTTTSNFNPIGAATSQSRSHNAFDDNVQHANTGHNTQLPASTAANTTSGTGDYNQLHSGTTSGVNTGGFEGQPTHNTTQSSQPIQTRDDHSNARDVALGATAATAAGAGTYAATHRERDIQQPTSTTDDFRNDEISSKPRHYETLGESPRDQPTYTQDSLQDRQTHPTGTSTTTTGAGEYNNLPHSGTESGVAAGAAGLGATAGASQAFGHKSSTTTASAATHKDNEGPYNVLASGTPSGVHIE